MIEFIIENWGYIATVILAITELLAKLYPTNKKVINLSSIIIKILSLIPDRKKGGGNHLK